jgi:hypothetical protein
MKDINFKIFLYISELSNNNSYCLENFNWAKKIGQAMPSLFLDLPTIQKQSRIEAIYDKKNPIMLQLSDGTKLFFSYDEYKRIEGNPQVGKSLIATMQRLPGDKTDYMSKITNCKVI